MSGGSFTETPPRTWGRQKHAFRAGAGNGNTPTDVGKTVSVIMLVPKPQKHPHGRGEDSILCRQSGTAMETPPRTWGRQPPLLLCLAAARNTPTDVGKTLLGLLLNGFGRKHPHGRGEDYGTDTQHHISRETPPRTWGRLSSLSADQWRAGNTPTDVGKTQ